MRVPSRDLAPTGKVQHLRETLEAFAKDNGLLIFEKNAFKIEWMAEHQGKCFCDWQHRACPCKTVFQDLKTFNGNCLCTLFCTEEKLKVLSRARKTVVKSPEEQKAYKEQLKQKQRSNEKLFEKLFKKKKKRSVASNQD
jgi:hypothetical protein